ncbi:MAG: hypothetical protein ACLRI7_11750 [Ruthenibacterium lactatiformans]
MLRTEGTEPLTSIDVSIDSHIMALAAEASRLHGGKTSCFQNLPRRYDSAQNS